MRLQCAQLDQYRQMTQACVTQTLLSARSIIENSAHGIFQMGHYYDCLEAPGLNYNMVMLAYEGVSTGIFGGLCLPSACTPEIITKQLDGALVLLGMPYKVGSVMDHVQDYSFPYTWVFYLTVIILAVTASLTLYATATNSKQRLLKGISLQQSLKIFKAKESDLNILNGVRTLAMMWVVLGHYYLTSIANAVNTMSIDEIFKKPFLLLVESGFTAVDIFFFLGGFFLAFAFMKEKAGGNLKYLLAILHRILRIWPAYVLAMMIYYSIFMHLGEGPMWPSLEPEVLLCRNMWRQMFFINNFVDNGEEMCLNWGWYLQVDFQIFLVCILLLFLYEKVHKISSYMAAAAMIVGSIAFNIVYTEKHQQKLLTDLKALQNEANFFVDLYIKPYARWTPYFMGLFIGILYHQYKECDKNKNARRGRAVQIMFSMKERFEKHKLLRIVVEWSGIAIMAFFVLILRTLQTGHKWPQIWHSLYSCLEKPFFIIGLLMVTFPTILGCKGSFFQLLLNNKLFNFLAKISFCTYLVHLMVIMQYTSSRTFDNYYSLLATFPLYLGCLVASCLFGFLMTVFIEIPFSVWQKEFTKSLMNGVQRTEKKDEKSQELIYSKINRTIQIDSQLREINLLQQ